MSRFTICHKKIIYFGFLFIIFPLRSRDWFPLFSPQGKYVKLLSHSFYLRNLKPWGSWKNYAARYLLIHLAVIYDTRTRSGSTVLLLVSGAPVQRGNVPLFGGIWDIYSGSEYRLCLSPLYVLLLSVQI